MWTNGIYDGHGKTKMGLQYSIPDMPMFETETNPKTPRRNVGFGDTSIDEYTSLFGGIDYHSSILQLQSPMSRPPGGFTLPVSALGYPFPSPDINAAQPPVHSSCCFGCSHGHLLNCELFCHF
jgi:hypothetical protein